MNLDTAELEAILKEARECFLYEDAPSYVADLEQGLQALSPLSTTDQLTQHYPLLMRAAHSLKGGAGIAELTLISRLAHKLEDGFQGLTQGQLHLDEALFGLIQLTTEQLRSLLGVATTQNGEFDTHDQEITESLITVWSESLANLTPLEAVESEFSAAGCNDIPSEMLRMVLETDLEDCLQRVEDLLALGPTASTLRTALVELGDECILLGQALGQAWLTETIAGMQLILQDQHAPVHDLAAAILTELRILRSEVLGTLAPAAQTLGWDELKPLDSVNFEHLGDPQAFAIASTEALLLEPMADPAVVEVLEAIAAESSPPSALPDPPLPKVGDRHRNEPRTPELNPVSKAPTFLNLRIPVSRLDRMTNLVGELLISYERLALQQHQLQQTSLALKKQTQQLTPINEEVRIFYDQLATAGIGTLGGDGEGRPSEFDVLAFDQYTSLHTTLQHFQELMVQVQESRADIDWVSRDFQESLVQLRQQLGGLYQDLTTSRLVPFKGLAERFVAPLQSFCQRFNKLVDLEIVGADTMIDQVLLEQLQTPLTHLLRNAFDHGIESLEERLSSGKNPTASIRLAAEVRGNEVRISITDDGRGINLDQVYARARQQNLCTLDRDDLTDEQIREFLFAPGFSTAKEVTELSGRGVGLDAVRSQITQLRGSIAVTSELEVGTTFTILLPLSLNILPLLLCRCQQQTLAIPSLSIREVIALTDYLEDDAQTTQIQWQDQTIPLFSLIHWLPYRRAMDAVGRIRAKLGVVLEVQGQPIAVAVDSLLGERELVLKPFDLTVPVPAYVAGCTVLGTGEVVPVLSPDHLTLLLGDRIAPQSTPIQPQTPASVSTGAPIILIADDSVAVRRFLEKILTSTGYRVVACRDGKEALDALEQEGETYSMVITDIEMPRLDGLGLLRSIRTDARFAQLPVAMLTSRDNAQHRKKAEGLGANAYFTKPFQPNELLAGVETFCGVATTTVE